MLSAYHNAKVTWHRFKGRDANGVPLPTADRPLRCRFERKTRMVRNQRETTAMAAGETVASSATITMPKEPNIEDQFTHKNVRYGIVAIGALDSLGPEYGYEVSLA